DEHRGECVHLLPWPAAAVGEDGGRTFRNASEYLPQSVVKGNDRLAPLVAFAGRNDDRVVADVGPAQTQQIAKSQAGMRGEIDGVGNLGRAGFRPLQLRDVGVRPDNLGAVAAVELLDALAWVASDLTERID